MRPVIKLKREDLTARRRALLDRLGISEEDLQAKAEAYTLTPEQRQVWEELGEIRFLLAEN